MSERVVLYINASSSRCGACGMNCLPDEDAHVTPSGWDQRPGCGATFTHVSTHSISASAMRSAVRMRPDLIPADMAVETGLGTTHHTTPTTEQD